MSSLSLSVPGFVKEKMGMGGAVKMLTIKVAKTMTMMIVIETATDTTENLKMMMTIDTVVEFTNNTWFIYLVMINNN